ncbi:glutamate synthase [Actinosynnema sp. ALI-1.44]|uniref:glutamate synthase-related protein n=1 Tax=Actinosynnema sp. ALI-1.44 TaxID=1933779 RepID=UPI00097C8B8F|nr:glutamate synthase-related protein [Actinosynnema sp. ALI-1.44]ONI76021.1 glutamate synthase [Actinosynnema sp. ALI-1.44]
MNRLRAEGFPEQAIRARARDGAAAAFPPVESYGTTVYGATGAVHRDPLDAIRLAPPIFTPNRMDKLLDLAREPTYGDVDLTTVIGGFTAPVPVYLSAFGSTRVAGPDIGLAISGQAGRLGVPVVIGENVVPVNGYGRLGAVGERSLLRRVRAYAEQLPDGLGGLVVQQSTEDADAEVWNLVYSDPSTRSLLDSGRLGFELKVGQGAKPGIGGMTVLDRADADRVGDQYSLDLVYGAESGRVLRCSSPGTFTPEILRQQIRLMRNNFPRAKTWVKLHPGRDVREAAAVAWQAGADAVTVDGAEGGTGWAPLAFLDHVGLPLGECLTQIDAGPHCLLASGGVWEGARAVKCLALGARAVGLGRAGLLAADEDTEHGLTRLIDCLAFELRLLISSLGEYAPGSVGIKDVWAPGLPVPTHTMPLAGIDTRRRQ